MKDLGRKNVGIVGFGRFGRFWAELLSTEYEVMAADKRDLSEQAGSMGLAFKSLAEICEQAETLFLCVPISQLEPLVKDLKPHLKPGTLVIDTCSVKVHPASVMEKAFDDDDDIELIASHPMFGPDSAIEGAAGLPIVMWPLRVTDERYGAWRGSFERMGMKVVELSPDHHDQLAANSQGVTHYMGRVIGELNLQETPIDTKGFQILLSIVEQICNDSLELFQDLQYYNPYTKEMRLNLEEALRKVYGQLLPPRVVPGNLVVGIQGGQGSFNEEACRTYCSSQNIDSFGLEFLYTTENVLDALHQGLIDRGIFAVQSAKGGVVMESLEALGRYHCEIADRFEILVDHCLLLHPDVEFKDIKVIISHPQALAQCQGNLETKYPNLALKSGEGELIDQALCARYLAEGKLPGEYAVLAPKVCAELFDLRIHATSLQDYGEMNLTTFLWVKRGKL